MFKITCLIIFFLTLTVQRINTVNGESLSFQMLTGSSCAKHCKFECKPDEAAMAKCNGKDCQCWSIGKTGGSINRIIKSSMNVHNTVDPTTGKSNIFNMTLGQAVAKIFDLMADLQPKKF